MNTKANFLCLVLLSATWMVARSIGSGSAGSGAAHAGTAGQSPRQGRRLLPETRIQPRAPPRRPPALLRPRRVPQHRNLALPVPSLEPLPTPTALHSNRRTTRRRQAQLHRGRKLLALPPRHPSSRCPTASRQTISHQTMARMGARPHPLRISGIRNAKFSAGSSMVPPEQFGTPAQAAERFALRLFSAYAAEPGFWYCVGTCTWMMLFFTA